MPGTVDHIGKNSDVLFEFIHLFIASLTLCWELYCLFKFKCQSLPSSFLLIHILSHPVCRLNPAVSARFINQSPPVHFSYDSLNPLPSCSGDWLHPFDTCRSDDLQPSSSLACRRVLMGQILIQSSKVLVLPPQADTTHHSTQTPHEDLSFPT